MSNETSGNKSTKDLEIKLAAVEKRMDDVKFYFVSLTGIFTLIFSVYAALLTVNFNGEKDDLREFKKETKEALGLLPTPPSIQAFTSAGDSLAGQDVTAIKDPSDNKKIIFNVVLKNIGGSFSDKLVFQFYTNDPLSLKEKSPDEKSYTYIETQLPNEIRNAGLAPKMSNNFTMAITGTTPLAKGKYPIFLKIFGGNTFAQYKFNLVVPD